MNADIKAAIDAWESAVMHRDIAISNEINARAHLMTLAYPNPVIGTNNTPLGDGRNLKAVFKETYTLEQPRIEETLKLLPSGVRGGLVKWKGDLSLSAYKALEPAHKTIINDILTIKPARPSLEITVPKER